MQVKKDQSMWLSSLGDVELLWWDSNILVCSHEPSTSHPGLPRTEWISKLPSGTAALSLQSQPCCSVFELQIKGTNSSESFYEMHSSAEVRQRWTAIPWILFPFDTRCKSPRRESIPGCWSRWSRGLFCGSVTSGCFHWCRIFFLSLCCQTSSRKKPAARIGTPLGSKVRALPATQSGHLQAHIKATALVSSFLPGVCCFGWPPPAKGFLCTNSVPLSAPTTVTEVGSYHWAEVRFTSAACHLSLYDLSRVSS